MRLEFQVRADSVEKRFQFDRRKTPTPFWRRPGVPARRSGFRREGEGVNAYVDRFSRPMAVSGILLILLSALDAYLSLIHMQYGAQEMVPTMAWAIERGVVTFVSLKLAVTSVGVVYLVVHQNFSLARLSLYFLLVLSSSLLIYHVVLAVFYW